MELLLDKKKTAVDPTYFALTSYSFSSDSLDGTQRYINWYLACKDFRVLGKRYYVVEGLPLQELRLLFLLLHFQILLAPICLKMNRIFYQTSYLSFCTLGNVSSFW